MIHRMARFTVRRDAADDVREETLAYAQAVLEREPGVLTYDVFLEDDGVTFQHRAVFKDQRAVDAHADTGHARAFADIVYPLCQRDPHLSGLRVLWLSGEQRRAPLGRPAPPTVGPAG